MSQAQVARALGMSRAWVQLTERRALSKLRAELIKRGIVEEPAPLTHRRRGR